MVDKAVVVVVDRSASVGGSVEGGPVDVAIVDVSWSVVESSAIVVASSGIVVVDEARSTTGSPLVSRVEKSEEGAVGGGRVGASVGVVAGRFVLGGAE